MVVTQRLYRISWRHEDPASPALIEPLMDDIFGRYQEMDSRNESRAWKATYNYLLNMIKEPDSLFTMGDISDYGIGYFDGYLALLKEIEGTR